MTRRLDRLAQIAEMVRARDMAQLARLRAAQAETRARRDALARPGGIPDDPALFRAQQAHLRWAQAQRAALAGTLARQQAAILEQQVRAARSTGRAQVVAKLRQRGR